jgi:hypothetical protein
MSSTISGNVGGAAAVGAQIQCLNVLTKNVIFSAADASGNYSVTVQTAGAHIMRAFLNASVYYHPVQVVVDGTSAYTGINLTPTALTAANAPPQATNY